MASMEKVNFDYSMKNIPLHSLKEYRLQLTDSVGKFVHNLRWTAFHFLNKTKKQDKKTYDFRSTRAAPVIPELKKFEESLYDLVRSVEPRRYHNSLLNKLEKDKAMISKEKKLIVSADKTSNFYKMENDDYQNLLETEIHKGYKKASEDDIAEGNKEQLDIVTNLEIDDRVYSTVKRPAFVTLKDHKANFREKPSVRLLNPTKPEVGRISKQILTSKIEELREKTGYHQWKNSFSVIDWFKRIDNKSKCKFIVFDIVEFYPSISEKLLREAISWASSIVNFTPEEIEIILKSKKSLLWNKDVPWRKKGESNFDVTMGSYDGAEACDLVGLRMLNQLQDLSPNIQIGLFRDDGLAVSTLSAQQTENIAKKMCEIFKKNELRITVEVNLSVVDYLDVTLDLTRDEYRPYIKPNDKPQYVHNLSNHPQAVLRNIPRGVNDRLSRLSSSEEVFTAAAPLYQEALDKSGYDFKLKFDPATATNANKGSRKNRTRTRKIVWFNPPFSRNIEKNIGKDFFKIVDNFPKNNILAGIINRNRIKMSYKTMKNMGQVISSHNQKVQNDSNHVAEEEPEPFCNCQPSKKAQCPLPGQCHTDRNGRVESVVYRAKITRQDTGAVEYYTGLTGGMFKKRWYKHIADIRNYNPDDGSFGKRMSKYVGKLKADNISCDISWSIVLRAPTYNPITRSCRLCLLEKYLIMFESAGATLNVKSEFFSTCLHKQKLLLKNWDKPG